MPGFRHYSTTGEYTANYATDSMYLIRPRIWVPSAGKVVIVEHGHGGSSLQSSPLQALGNKAAALVTAGYCVLAVDHAAINAWGDANAMRAMDDAYTYTTGTLGLPAGSKVGLMGWSMGGITALNWLRRNAAKVACAWLWNPATDLQFWQNTAYAPVYGASGVAVGTYASEIGTTFAPSTTATAAVTVPALGGVGVTVPLTNAKGFADANTAAGNALPLATFGTSTFTYTSKDDTHLYGCVSSTASTISVTSGGTVTGTYANQVTGYSPWVEYTAFRGLGVPIKLSQASDDATVPPGQNSDATNGFVARVNDANLTLRSPAPTGGHQGSIDNVPHNEVVQFFQAHL